MGRLAWSQVRFRLARTLALVAGVLVAATAFTVLTAASQTAQARTVGQVSANFQPAYDILVRPKGARSAVESKTGTVAPDFLSGIYGGLPLAEWDQDDGTAGERRDASAGIPVRDAVASHGQHPGRTLDRWHRPGMRARGSGPVTGNEPVR